MTKIYNTIKESIQFEVSDMLRAKCLFHKVEDINDCADKLKSKIE